MSQIKAKTNVETRDSASTESDTSSKDLGEAQSTKLKQMLASLKTSKTL
jgi:hypothetical protein